MLRRDRGSIQRLLNAGVKRLGNRRQEFRELRCLEVSRALTEFLQIATRSRPTENRLVHCGDWLSFKRKSTKMIASG